VIGWVCERLRKKRAIERKVEHEREYECIFMYSHTYVYIRVHTHTCINMYIATTHTWLTRQQW